MMMMMMILLLLPLLLLPLPLPLPLPLLIIIIIIIITIVAFSLIWALKFASYITASVCLWCIGRHSWIPCTILQTQSRPLTASSFYRWFDMARFIQGMFTIHQRTTWPSTVWQQTPRRSDSYRRVMVAALPGTSQLLIYCGPRLPEHIICLCSLSSWSGGQTQRREIFWNVRSY